MSGVVAAAVAAVNALQPGQRRGRDFTADTGPGEVADVLAAAGSQFARQVPEPAELDALRGYTGRFHAVFAAAGAGDMDRACTGVNRLLADTRAAPVLSRHSGEPWHLHFHAPGADWATGWAAPMATALAIVLGSPAADRLGVCSAGQCDRVFADTSRNGTRRFCSTACQNRAKAAAFRARKAGAGG